MPPAKIPKHGFRRFRRAIRLNPYSFAKLLVHL